MTESERYLARIAEISFLNLWSYPNPFRDQKLGGQGDGKEICDLLVVCGDQIIIFSEKNIPWPNGDLATAWHRWIKRAVKHAAKQAAGAERWISDYPDRIFLDRECTIRFPIDLPLPDNRVVHRVVVARGAADACRENIPGSTGSLIIEPPIKGDTHWPKDKGSAKPFSIGDVAPDDSFVHIFDEVALDIILGELDTILDFTEYLEKRAMFIRSGRLLEAHGEENLLAYYAIRINGDGDHDFVLKPDQKNFVIDRSHYPKFVADPQYNAKKEADKVSYFWDKLIELFTIHMLDGTSITRDGHEFELRKNEVGVRYMALTRRFERRNFGAAVADAFEKGKKKFRFFRLMISPEEAKGSNTAFFLFTQKYEDWMDEDGGYEKYRTVRTNYGLVYAKGILERFPYLKRIVGVCCEPPGQGRGGSEDLIYAEQHDWPEKDREAIRKDCEAFGVLREGMKGTPISDKEFPDVEKRTQQQPERKRPSRKERRAAAAIARKKGRK